MTRRLLPVPLTLQDVLDAHKNVKPSPLPSLSGAPTTATTPTATAPILTPSVPSSTGLMVSQGMKDVLQKVGVTAPAQGTKAAATASPTTQNLAAPMAASVSTDASGMQYQPGEAPKNLATGQTLSAPVTATTDTVATTAPTADTTTQTGSPSCGEAAEKWEKTCGDAVIRPIMSARLWAKPARGCADGALHDVWITNNCAPPDASSDHTEKVNGVLRHRVG